MTHPSLSPPQGEPPRGGAPRSLNAEAADRAADVALGFQLGTTTRDQIDALLPQIRDHIEVFAKAVEAGGGRAARGSWLEAQQLLAAKPAEAIYVFGAWSHVRELARVLRRLVSEHREQVASAERELPVREPQATLGALAKSRQTYLVPSGPAPEHKSMVTTSAYGRP
ncbi:DUF6415 family natural product biosynthesis protein [Streptomyces sp. NPDC057552]|uniref:DUF6415 family natural product biosynthesis protein n=1 Tax=Streptomyces sp. NPDC057552 TaxID=3350537 RepID=UPI0036BDD145